MQKAEYGTGGWVGIGTHQANPTVEMEKRGLDVTRFAMLPIGAAGPVR